MFILMIILLMFVFPVFSIFTELFFFHSTAGIIFLIGKWFVFWVVGVRLFTAGLRQVLNPKLTAEQILGIKNSEQLFFVRELGFANLSMGLLGMVSILNNNWIIPAAIPGCLFYGLASVGHIMKKDRNRIENFVMVSDLIVSAVLLVSIILNLNTI